MTNKLYILCGIPFSGKSTLANVLSKKLGFVRIDLDVVKFELFGSTVLDADIDQTGWDKVFEVMYEWIKENLVNGKTVISDTGNFTKAERDSIKAIADSLGIETITIFVMTAVDEAYRRLIENRKTKIRFNVTDEDFNSTVKEMEPPKNDEKHLIYRSTENVDEWIEKNVNSK